jgi:hypothetical protein
LPLSSGGVNWFTDMFRVQLRFAKTTGCSFQIPTCAFNKASFQIKTIVPGRDGKSDKKKEQNRSNEGGKQKQLNITPWRFFNLIQSK